MSMETTLIPKIKSEYLMKCSIKPGAFSHEYIVCFACYNNKGVLIKDSSMVTEDHIDIEKGYSRVDLRDIHNQIAEIELHNQEGRSIFKIPLENLVRNSQALEEKI